MAQPEEGKLPSRSVAIEVAYEYTSTTKVTPSQLSHQFACRHSLIIKVLYAPSLRVLSVFSHQVAARTVAANKKPTEATAVAELLLKLSLFKPKKLSSNGMHPLLLKSQLSPLMTPPLMTLKVLL